MWVQTPPLDSAFAQILTAEKTNSTRHQLTQHPFNMFYSPSAVRPKGNLEEIAF